MNCKICRLISNSWIMCIWAVVQGQELLFETREMERMCGKELESDWHLACSSRRTLIKFPCIVLYFGHDDDKMNNMWRIQWLCRWWYLLKMRSMKLSPYDIIQSSWYATKESENELMLEHSLACDDLFCVPQIWLVFECREEIQWSRWWRW